MKKSIVFGAISGLVLALGAPAASAIVIDPTDCGSTLSCITGSENSNSVITGVIEGLYPGIVEVYKGDQDGGEDGSFAGDYTTSYFNTPSDPEDALITWDGPNSINCPSCYVLVKDGGATMIAWYLIEINGWDGMEDLDLQNFWPAQGAISHVSIWASPIPVPAAVWLFGSALLGLVGIGRRARR